MAIVGALCGTTITALVPHTSPKMVLVSAILGAAIPAFVETAGRRRPLRIAMTIVATISALSFTYAGALVVSPVIHEEILPGSDAFNEGPHTDDPGTGPQDETSAPKFPITVTPSKLECHPGCERTVTIENVSPEPVVVDSIGFTGLDENDFDLLDQCEITIDEGKACTFEVKFDPADPNYDSHANLEISYGAPESLVIEAISHGNPHDPPSGNDTDLRVGEMTCTHLPASTPTEGGSLLVNVHLSAEGSTDELPDTIAVTATKDDQRSGRDNAAPNDSASITLPVSQNDYGHEHEITVVIDSDDKVDEGNEENNTASAHVVLPDRPDEKSTLNC